MNKKRSFSIFVQAHHENWGGGKSYCLSMIDGSPVVSHVLKKLRSKFPDLEITLLVPDENENKVFEEFALEVCGQVYYGPKLDVIERFLGAAKKSAVLPDAIIRVIGEHYFFDPNLVERMKGIFESGEFDLLTPPLDFDPKYGAEIVSLSALEKAKEILNLSDADMQVIANMRANPIQFIRSRTDAFECGICSEIPIYSHDQIKQMRDVARYIYLDAYQRNESRSQFPGDILRIHYEIAKKHLGPMDTVLDIACGGGWGSAILSSVCGHVTGADISDEKIREATNKYKLDNVEFKVLNAVATGLQAKTFDAVVSMETIEHIKNDKSFLDEAYRILKNKGVLIISTPQSSSGETPLVPYHVREYRLQEFKSLIKSKSFKIEAFYSFRSSLLLEGEHVGTGMMAVCRKL